MYFALDVEPNDDIIKEIEKIDEVYFVTKIGKLD